MERTEFLEKLTDILQVEDIVTVDMVLEDIEEWDSLSKMATISFLDNGFKVKVTFAEISEFKTVGDIVDRAGV